MPLRCRMYENRCSVIDIVYGESIGIIIIARNSHYAIFTVPQYAFRLSRRKLLFETSHSPCHHPNTLSPIIERIRVVMKKMRQKVAGSWKNTMPTMTAPTAPMSRTKVRKHALSHPAGARRVDDGDVLSHGSSATPPHAWAENCPPRSAGSCILSPVSY